MDLSRLAKLFTVDGPFVSIYLDTTSDVENAAQRLDLKWQNVQRDLDAEGVDRATIEALDASRGEHSAGDTRVLVAAHGAVQLATSLPSALPRDIVRIGPLPHLLPLVEALSMRVPHVVVLADRKGADVLAYASAYPMSGTPAETASVTNDRFPDRKVHAGGWAAKRYSNDVEETWEHSARDVAALVDRVSRDVDARVVMLSGDERAVQLVRQHLPSALDELVTVVGGGGRAVDGGEDVVADGVRAALGDRLARDTMLALEEFSEQRGRGDRACEGLAATVAALRMAQVATLLVSDAFDRDTSVWCGPEATHLAVSADELTALGIDDPAETSAADALVRAALGTGTEIRFVPAGVEQAPAEGVGGILRFSTT
jgi:hypothetical protein